MELFQEIENPLDSSSLNNSNDFKEVLIDCKTPDIVIISDSENIAPILDLKKKLENILQIKEINIKVIYFMSIKKELKTLIGETVFKNRFKEKIDSDVITLGRALFCFTGGNTDLQPHHFYDDNLLGLTSFYSKYYNCFVYPCDSLEELTKDDYPRFHFLNQCKKILYSEKRKIRLPKLSFEIVSDFKEFFKKFENFKKVAIDIETTGLDFLKDDIICITLSFDGKTGYYLRFKNLDTAEFNSFIKDKIQIWNNGKFDIKFLWRKGISNARIDEDNLALGHLINETRSQSLKSQAFYYDYFGGYDDELDEFLKEYKEIKSYGGVPEDILYKYACMDAIETFRINEVLNKYLDFLEEKLFKDNPYGYGIKKYYRLMIESNNMHIDIEYRGIFVDWNKLSEVSNKLDKMIKDKELEIRKELNIPEDINLNSNEQLGKYIDKLGWEDFGRTKKGYSQVNETILNKWAKKGYKGAKLIMELHELNTLMKTYIGYEKDNSGFWQYRGADDRVHSSYGIMLTESGRCYSRNPNLQNIPARGWKAELVRQIFIPPSEDYVFMSVDYSGLQLRLSAMVNGDEVFRNIFINGDGDLHSVTAANVILNKRISVEEFKKRKGEEDFKKARLKAKGLNFGLLFGAKSGTIKKTLIDLEWNEEDIDKYLKENNIKDILEYENKKDKAFTVAYHIRKAFFNIYKGLDRHLKLTILEAKKKGYVYSVYGAIRRVPELLYIGKDSNPITINNLENISLNTTIQSMESYIMQRSLLELYKWLKENNKKSLIIGSIHDAIELYVHRDEISELKNKIIEIFTKDYPEYNGIKLEVEGNISDYYKKNELWDMGSKW